MIAGAVEAPSGLPGSCVSSEPPPQVTDALGASVRALFLAAGLPSRVQDPCLTSSSPDAPSSWPSGHLSLPTSCQEIFRRWWTVPFSPSHCVSVGI